MLTRLFSLAALATLSSPAFASAPIGFQAVDKAVYRGGRPASEGQMQFLVGRGIHTIVNLQGDGWAVLPGETEQSIEKSREMATRAGMRFFNFQVPPGRTLDAHGEKLILDAVRVMEDPQLEPVYVHCNVGADRTGVVIAAYRILHDNCSFDAAVSELKRKGAPWTPILEHAQFDFLRALAANPERYGHARSALRCPL